MVKREFSTRRLSTVEAAARLRLAEVTLRKWRKRGYGPKWYRIGPGRGTIYYLSVDVDAWLATLPESDGTRGALSSEMPGRD